MVTVVEHLVGSGRNSRNFAQHSIDKQVASFTLRDVQLIQQLGFAGTGFEFDIYLGNVPSAPEPG